jgi:hypothetical protein
MRSQLVRMRTYTHSNGPLRTFVWTAGMAAGIGRKGTQEPAQEVEKPAQSSIVEVDEEKEIADDMSKAELGGKKFVSSDGLEGVAEESVEERLRRIQTPTVSPKVSPTSVKRNLGGYLRSKITGVKEPSSEQTDPTDSRQPRMRRTFLDLPPSRSQTSRRLTAPMTGPTAAAMAAGAPEFTVRPERPRRTSTGLRANPRAMAASAPAQPRSVLSIFAHSLHTCQPKRKCH